MREKELLGDEQGPYFAGFWYCGGNALIECHSGDLSINLTKILLDVLMLYEYTAGGD